MSKIKTVTSDGDHLARASTSDVDLDAHLLHHDELDAVSGGRAGGAQVKYMEYKLKEVFVSSV